MDNQKTLYILGGALVGLGLSQALNLARSKKTSKNEKIVIGYWAIRGLGAPLRMMLEYVGAEYEDVQYTDGSKWFKQDKAPLQAVNPLANLPYVKLGETVVSQSNACVNYIGDRFGLNGETDAEKLATDQLLCEVMDLRNATIDLVYPFRNVTRNQEEFDVSAPKFLAGTVQKHYTKLEAWIGNKKFLVRDTPTTADFHFWEMIDQQEKLARAISRPSPLDGFPKLQAYYAAFRNLPQLQKYFASAAYSMPCNNGIANCYFK